VLVFDVSKTNTATEEHHVLRTKISIATRDGFKIKECYRKMEGIDPGNCAVGSTYGIITSRLVKYLVSKANLVHNFS